jgi:hypothetical protein
MFSIEAMSDALVLRIEFSLCEISLGAANFRAFIAP